MGALPGGGNLPWPPNDCQTGLRSLQIEQAQWLMGDVACACADTGRIDWPLVADVGTRIRQAERQSSYSTSISPRLNLTSTLYLPKS